jgi:hemoglobin
MTKKLTDHDNQHSICSTGNMEKKEIKSLEEIKTLVNSFYGKVRVDQLLGPIFNGAIKDRWPEHLEKLARFWQTILLEEHTYFGRPFPPHAKLPVSQKHFDRWLELFRETVDENFIGEKAEEAKTRAEKMAEIFMIKINYFNNNKSASPL